MISILIVCLGNICRSPALQTCLQKIVDDHNKREKYYIDSCGMHSSFCGSQADHRTKKAAEKKNLIISHIAREFEAADYTTFDYILAVTKEIQRDLCSLAPDKAIQKKIYLATHFSKLHKDKDIPDPYYKGEKGFDLMMDVLSELANELFHHFERL